MTQFNDNLQRALNETTADENSIRELLELAGQTFSGQAKWITIAGWVKTILFLIIAVIAAFQFFKADSTRAMLAWSTVFIACTTSMTAMVLFYWGQLNRNAVTREIKRLELTVARMAQEKR
jgi:hypothetical protein